MVVGIRYALLDFNINHCRYTRTAFPIYNLVVGMFVALNLGYYDNYRYSSLQLLPYKRLLKYVTKLQLTSPKSCIYIIGYVEVILLQIRVYIFSGMYVCV